jgi:hypothetical protein
MQGIVGIHIMCKENYYFCRVGSYETVQGAFMPASLHYTRSGSMQDMRFNNAFLTTLF